MKVIGAPKKSSSALRIGYRGLFSITFRANRQVVTIANSAAVPSTIPKSIVHLAIRAYMGVPEGKKVNANFQRIRATFEKIWTDAEPFKQPNSSDEVDISDPPADAQT